MIIFRYLAKEVFVTLAALTLILLLIFMSNQFVIYLNSAARGRFPILLVMKLMLIEVPMFMTMLLPLGFYMSVLLAYGRLYADCEMTVLQACGYGTRQLLQHTFIMAFIVGCLVMSIMLFASPKFSVARTTLLRTTGIQTLIQTIIPDRFMAFSNGNQVAYVRSMSRDHRVAKDIFFARLVPKDGQKEWDVLWAQSATAHTKASTNEDYVLLNNGKTYSGHPGKADYQVGEFESYKARLPHPKVDINEDIRTLSTSDLLTKDKTDLKKSAEFQWRLTFGFMVFVLTLLAVPLSRVNPRMGKYAKLLPAILIFIVYANGVFVSREWMETGKTPFWIGMWWIHFPFLLLGLILLWRNRVKLS